MYHISGVQDLQDLNHWYSVLKMIFYQVLNKTIIVNLGGVEYDSFVNYSDHDHAQAVSKAFHRAARDLPFMPLKFPAEGDFNNEEVSVLSLRQLS